MIQPSARREFTPASIAAASAAAVGMVVSVGPMIAATFGLFLGAFAKEYHWSRTSFSAVILLTAWIGALATPIAGRAIDRFGARRVIIPGVVWFGLAFMGVSLVHGQIWQLYALYALVGLGASVQNAVAYSKVVSMWFQRRRGLVLGLISVAYGLGYAIMPQALRALLASYGWRTAYVALGGVILAALLILIPFLRTPAKATAAEEELRPVTGDSIGTAMRSAPFWMILTAFFLGVMSLVGTVAHAVPMLTDRGLSLPLAVNVVSLVALGSIVGQLSYGLVVDHIDTPKVGVPFFLCALAGAAIVHWSHSGPLLMVGGFVMGIGMGAEIGLAAYFTGRYYGTRCFGEIYGYVYAAITVGSGVGPLLMGVAYDRLGSYRPMLIASEAALAMVVVILLCLRPYTYGSGGGAIAARTDGRPLESPAGA